jgi:hypothetical protein
MTAQTSAQNDGFDAKTDASDGRYLHDVHTNTAGRDPFQLSRVGG